MVNRLNEALITKVGEQLVQKATDTRRTAGLFSGWDETILWSCLQGVMGELYVDDIVSPKSAMAILGDFAFFAGIPNRELVLFKPEWCRQEYIIMVPQNAGWAEEIVYCYKEKAKKVLRYAIKKEPDVFDRKKLRLAADSLPEGFACRLIDEDIYNVCKSTDWARDLVSQYKDYETYSRLGLGAVILKDDEVVSGASSYSSYLGGIEIEIDTKESYRRQGLAYACGARLLTECLDRNLYPSWDAQNLYSVALAEKLGYHYSHAYTAYEIKGYCSK
ncbi:MAG: GNAT family N-acetyltransferase [Lachnospiraceae bacterium]|nr:GNAT family N-acetyltransferase [Lachnospiraceae bacterium]